MGLVRKVNRQSVTEGGTILEPSLSSGAVGFSEKFELGRLLGSGTFGEVWGCTEKCDSDGLPRQYACKVFQKASIRSSEERACLRKEIKMLEDLKGQHRGIVQLKEAMESEGAVQVVMELCSGGDLFELLKSRGKLPEPAARFVFCQLASAMAHLHSRGILHRDIKPENILFDQPATCLYHMTSNVNVSPPIQTKLSDFGLAEYLKPGDTTAGFVGSKHYVAPELLMGRRYGRRVDVWSLGVVLCAMLTGKLPFYGRTPSDSVGLRRAIMKGRVDFTLKCWKDVSDSAKDLVHRMLELEPHKRLKSNEILAHPWVASEPAQAQVPRAQPAMQTLDSSDMLCVTEAEEKCTVLAEGKSIEMDICVPPSPALGVASQDVAKVLEDEMVPHVDISPENESLAANKAKFNHVGGLQGFCHRVLGACAMDSWHSHDHPRRGSRGKYQQHPVLEIASAVILPHSYY